MNETSTCTTITNNGAPSGHRNRASSGRVYTHTAGRSSHFGPGHPQHDLQLGDNRDADHQDVEDPEAST